MEEVMSNPPLPQSVLYTPHHSLPSYTHACVCGADWLVMWPTLDAGLELKLKQWCHQTFSVATETRSVLTLCEWGWGFHARLNTWLTNVPSAVTHSVVRVFLLHFWLFPTSVRCEEHLTHVEEILCTSVEKKITRFAVCVSSLNSVLFPELQRKVALTLLLKPIIQNAAGRTLTMFTVTKRLCVQTRLVLLRGS